MTPRTPIPEETSTPGRSASQSGHRVVQVELRAALRRVGVRATSKSPLRFATVDESDISGLHGLLNRHKVDVAHPSFRIRHTGQRRRRRQREKDHLSRFVDLHFPAGVDVAAVLRELRELPEVAQAVEVRALIPASIPTDPLIGTNDQLGFDPASGWEYQWYLYRCRAQGAWAHASGNGVVIADLDSGFFLEHDELAPNLELSHMHNAFDGSSDVTVGPEVSHGTAVLGIAGASANGAGIAGFAYGARLWPIQINAGNNTQLAGDALANAIDWVTGEDSGGRRVVILVECQTDNGGNCEQRLAVNAAIRLAIAKGFVVCVTAGNGDRDASLADDGTPIAATGSILVGATAYDAAMNPRAVWELAFKEEFRDRSLAPEARFAERAKTSGILPGSYRLKFFSERPF